MIDDSTPVQTTAPISMLDAALSYAHRDWKVFPLVPGEKVPATAHGVNDATTDPAVIRQWWADQPDANVGVACGPSRLLVVDLDVKPDPATGTVKDGIVAWKRLATEYGIPDSNTLTSSTPSGGRHLVYAMPPGDPLRNTAGTLAPGVDTRGDGGYIVAPPSRTAAGVYSWQDWAAAVAPCPPALPLILRGEESHTWRDSRITFAEIIGTPPPRTEWLVDHTLEAGALSIIYGAPGCLKSMLAADLAVCVAAGMPFLGGMPGTGVAARGVTQRPVVWIDIDNGRAVSHRRFAALAKARGLADASGAVHCFPPIDLCHPPAVLDFQDLILAEDAGLVVIDTLLNAASVSSENDSAQMRVPMFALRKLAEQTGATIILIHHTNKKASTEGHGDIRGSTVIVGAVDSAFRVERPDVRTGDITVTATKSRNLPVGRFSAAWTYSDDHLGELQSGRFFGTPAGQPSTAGQEDLRKKIIEAVGDGPLSVNKILGAVKGNKTKLTVCLQEMEAAGELTSTPGPRNSRLYASAKQ